MKKTFLVILAVLLAVCCLAAQSTTKSESGKLAGKWQMSVDTPHGPMTGPLDVHQEGAKLTGTLELEQIGSLTLNGKVDGDKVSFNMEIPGAGVTISFTGTVDGDKMSGKMSGASDHAGNWSATRS